jgi:hypothetical protein
MSQVVSTIHTVQTTGGPGLEARMTDSVLGDVKMTVTGQAGQIVEAQLVVRDRVTADALLSAAARSHASGDALTGVNLSVRTESGGSWTSNGRSGGNASEALAWGQGGGPHQGPGDGSAPRGNDSSALAGGGNGTGNGSAAGGSHGSERSPAAPVRPSVPAPLRRLTTGLDKSGGSSLDVRA